MEENEIIIVHYHSKSGDYLNRSVWLWRDGYAGERYKFERDAHDSLYFRDNEFGVSTVVTIPRTTDDVISSIHFLICDEKWTYKSSQYNLLLQSPDNMYHVWVVENDPTLYYARAAALTSVHYKYSDPHAFDIVLNSEEFDRKWGYSGWLGYRYRPHSTRFKLWAPTAKKVELLLYKHFERKSQIVSVVEMTRGTASYPDDHTMNTCGVWSANVHKNLHNTSYAYRLYHSDGRVVISPDPYARAATRRGDRSVVLREDSMNLSVSLDELSGQALWRAEHIEQAVICEMHIRDFSISPSSGVPPIYRGKFLGASYKGTKNQWGDPSGFDYIKRQGYSYVQLQPVADYHKTYLPGGKQRYNWGYDPQNYNVPDSSYSTQPDNPSATILELKRMIRQYHQAGIGVILDVVYNHTFSHRTHPFNLTVPDYFYRINADGSYANGSGCGNEIASEKEMCRKYIVDSVLYWAREYGVDGFRFDLMGLLDIDTMNEIRRKIDYIDPRIVLYGEGWNIGTHLDQSSKAIPQNAARLPRIGFFNDQGRNSVKGAEVFGNLQAGFVSDNGGEGVIAKAILGSDELAALTSPGQAINYVEAHDNYNLNDLLNALHPQDSYDIHIKRVELANALNVVMQGVCFMQLGQEFLRTKLHGSLPGGRISAQDRKRAMNSYNSPDVVNQINWNLTSKYHETVDFIRHLVELKKNSGALSFTSYRRIRDHVYIFSAVEESGFIGFDTSTNQKAYRIVATTVKKSQAEVLEGFEGAKILLTNGNINDVCDSTLEPYTFVVYEKVLA